MEYFLEIAGVRLCIEIPETLSIGKAFLPFLTEPGTEDLRAEFCPVVRLRLPEGGEVFRENCLSICRGENGFVRCYYREPNVSQPYALVHPLAGKLRVEYLPSDRDCLRELGQCVGHLGLEGVLLRRERLCLHASCVSTPVGGLLFAGPSGIGKSTQARLWCRHGGGTQINGDRPVLGKNGDEWRAWGSPYAGSSGIHVNESCPVRAVMILRQAPQCDLRRLEGAEAFRKLFACLTVNSWDPDFVNRACDLCLELSARVPVYEFACTPDIRAVEALKEELERNESGWSPAYP